jgi:adenosylhomocysteine nucleosidase
VRIAVLGTFGAEANLIKEAMCNSETKLFLDREFRTGSLHGQEIITTHTGDMVNAGLTMGLLLTHYNPEKVILTGIAGSLNPQINLGDVVIVEKCVQYECGEVISEGFRLWGTWDYIKNRENPKYFDADEEMLKVAKAISDKVTLKSISETVNSKVILGTGATGNKLLKSKQAADNLFREYKADVVDMECAAIAQICYQYDIPFLAVKSISDQADESFKEEGEIAYEVACFNADQLVIELIRYL